MEMRVLAAAWPSRPRSSGSSNSCCIVTERRKPVSIDRGLLSCGQNIELRHDLSLTFTCERTEAVEARAGGTMCLWCQHSRASEVDSLRQVLHKYSCAYRIHSRPRPAGTFVTVVLLPSVVLCTTGNSWTLWAMS